MASGGGKRKIGHNAKRSVSMANYRNSGRMLTNKKRRIKKEADRQVQCKLARQWIANSLPYDGVLLAKDVKAVSRCVRQMNRATRY